MVDIPEMVMDSQFQSWHEQSGPLPSHEPCQPTSYKHLNDAII